MHLMPWQKKCATSGLLVVCAVFLFPFQASSQTIKSFEASGSGKVSGEGTMPAGINMFGEITGSVIDGNDLWHGFVRKANGKSSVFDAPGANPSVGCTCPAAINDFGVVVGTVMGTVVEGNFTFTTVNGFVRSVNGKITLVSPEGAESTFLDNVNDLGEATGRYFDIFGQLHGFLRSANGQITEIADPLGGIVGGQGTWPYAINNLGIVSGLVTDSQFTGHGFLRMPGGNFTNFDVPGALGIQFVNGYVNDLGVVAGTYVAQEASDQFVEAGFQRLPNGKFTVFSAPTGPLFNLSVTALDIRGTVTGFYEMPGGLDEAFVRFVDGQLVTLEFPSGTQESVGIGINALDTAVGWWIDAEGAYHGYTWSPDPQTHGNARGHER
ncbi:MAG TPA: hypothetical protein VGI45_25065 [Terracidiphilus sp.]|jgi:hypothetical protein